MDWGVLSLPLVEKYERRRSHDGSLAQLAEERRLIFRSAADSVGEAQTPCVAARPRAGTKLSCSEQRHDHLDSPTSGRLHRHYALAADAFILSSRKPPKEVEPPPPSSSSSTLLLVQGSDQEEHFWSQEAAILLGEDEEPYEEEEDEEEQQGQQDQYENRHHIQPDLLDEHSLGSRHFQTPTHHQDTDRQGALILDEDEDFIPSTTSDHRAIRVLHSTHSDVDALHPKIVSQISVYHQPDKTLQSRTSNVVKPSAALRRKPLTVLSIANGSCQRMQFGTSELLKIVHLNRPLVHGQNIQDHISGTLKLRDLRQITSSGVGSQRPSIEPRRSCILVNMPSVKALIMRNRIFLLARYKSRQEVNDLIATKSPRGVRSSSVLSPSNTASPTYRLQASHLSPDSEFDGVASSALVQKLIRVSEMHKAAPFEFLVLESILFEVISKLSEALTPVQLLADRVQNQQTYVLSSTAKLHEIRDTKRVLQEIEGMTKGVAKSLEEILEKEEDVRRLEISRFWEKPEEWEDPSDSPCAEDAEILLESYQQDTESLLHKIDCVDETLDTLLQIMQLHLATTRNNLMKFEIGLQVISVVVGVVAAIAGIFGMNIPNGFESDSSFFWSLSSAMGWVIVLVSVSVFLFILRLKL